MPSSILRSAAAAGVLALTLAACGSQSVTGAATSATPSSAPSSASPASTAASPSASGPTVAAQGSYIDYAAYSANPQMYSGGKVVLFFAASWCPTCREADKNLTGDPASIPTGLTIVKTDYDSETDLRQKYGVSVQHTFVQVDPAGDKLATWSGSLTGESIAGRTV